MDGSVLLLVSTLLFATFAVSLSDQIFIADWEQLRTVRPGSSIRFRVQGNVYPLGRFTVRIRIGKQPQDFELDIDTGSDVTWVQCNNGGACTGCTLPPEKRYILHNNALRCGEPLCEALFYPKKVPWTSPNHPCVYEAHYADDGSSTGVMAKDIVRLSVNGKFINPHLGFGCGYSQKNMDSVAGVLGLGSNKATIISQLSDLGYVSNVFGHCFDKQGGGFLFFGEDTVLSLSMLWTSISSGSDRYSAEPEEIFFGGVAVGIRDLTVTFDSGATYTYFNSRVYGVIEKRLKNDLKRQPLREASEDKTLDLCWKGKRPFQSVDDVKSFFKPLALSFSNSKNVRFEIPPEAYLIISEFGNVCLGILNGTEVGLENDNIIGDISMLNKIVAYDNERKQIGWAPFPGNCNEPPKNEAW